MSVSVGHLVYTAAENVLGPQGYVGRAEVLNLTDGRPAPTVSGPGGAAVVRAHLQHLPKSGMK